jgi:hypothetical protein
MFSTSLQCIRSSFTLFPPGDEFSYIHTAPKYEYRKVHWSSNSQFLFEALLSCPLPHIVWSNSLVSHNCTPLNTSTQLTYATVTLPTENQGRFFQGYVHEIYCIVLLSTK